MRHASSSAYALTRVIDFTCRGFGTKTLQRGGLHVERGTETRDGRPEQIDVRLVADPMIL